MGLKKYNKKRNFDVTTEPQKNTKPNKNKIFVVQFHQARSDHYDFRLEFNRVLKSWAIPKQLPKKVGEKRLAVMVEDHPLSYANFEGVIPPKQYGAGTVEIWDKGTYSANSSIKKGLKDGKISVNLFGEKLKGSWALVKMQDNNWLIIKENDKIDFSVVSEKNPKNTLKTTTKKLPFNKLDVKLCTLTNQIPTGKNWLFEIKYDGYRIVSYILNGKAKLVTRGNVDYSQKLSFIKQLLQTTFTNQSLILDGEIVAFDSTGRSDFGLLQENLKTNQNIAYVVFDILAKDGKDLRSKPLLERKQVLEKIFPKNNPNLILSQYVINKGKQSFNLAKKHNLEGIVAKNIHSTYSGKRNEDWLKIKCYKRQEFVIVGYTTTVKNKNLSAILLGYYDKNKLIYVGKVGTGFTEKSRKELGEKLSKIKIKKSKISNISEVDKNAIFVSPKLVCEVHFAEITKENMLRQASFVGLRKDKNPKEISLEYKTK